MTMRTFALVASGIALGGAGFVACGPGEGSKPSDTGSGGSSPGPVYTGTGGLRYGVGGGSPTQSTGGTSWSPIGSAGTEESEPGECAEGAPCTAGSTCTDSEGQTCECRQRTGTYRCD